MSGSKVFWEGLKKVSQQNSALNREMQVVDPPKSKTAQRRQEMRRFSPSGVQLRIPNKY